MVFFVIEHKFYIGSSENLSERFKEHIKGKKSNIRLQRSIIKYGLENFQFIIFKFCSKNEENLLIDLETKYLSFFDFKSLYNFKSIASSMLGYKHTEEAIRKMRILNKGKKHPFFGKHHTKESISKISLATKGNKNPMYGKNHSDYTKNLISNSLSRQVFVYKISEKTSELVFVFSNSVKVAYWLGVHKSTIGRYIKSGKV
jgi:group I intron endonuclease